MTESTAPLQAQRSSADIVVTAGVLLTAAPGFGYLVAWVDQVGYEQHFQVPLALIAPQLGFVLAATVAVATCMVGIFAMAEAYLSSRRPRPPGPIESRLLLLAGLAVFLGYFLYLAWSWGTALGPYPVVTWAASVVVAALMAFAPGLFGHPRTFRDRLEQADKNRRPDPPSVLSTALISRIGQGWFFLLPAILLVLLGAYDFGSYQAVTQTDFLVSDTSPTSPPEVVVAIYGDTVVLAPFDKSKHVVHSEFDIVKLGAQPLHLHWMTVGPLARG